MSIRDELIINMYNSLTNERIETYELWNIINDTQNIMVTMNMEELVLWKKLKEQLKSKNDVSFKFGYKA